jgi:hypothetical protein
MKHVFLLAAVLTAIVSGALSDVVAAPSRQGDEHWTLLRVSPSGRILVLQAVGGGCGHDPRAITTERPHEVEIRVRQLVPADRHAICPMIARIDTLRVRLSSPIAGRSVVHQSLRSVARPRAMPRVLGLRISDARFALRAHGFRVKGDRNGTV